MPRNQARQNLRQIAFDDVQIRPTHAAGTHPKQQLLWSRRWLWNLSNHERCVRVFLRRDKEGRLHRSLLVAFVSAQSANIILPRIDPERPTSLSRDSR